MTYSDNGLIQKLLLKCIKFQVILLKHIKFRSDLEGLTAFDESLLIFLTLFRKFKQNQVNRTNAVYNRSPTPKPTVFTTRVASYPTQASPQAPPPVPQQASPQDPPPVPQQVPPQFASQAPPQFLPQAPLPPIPQASVHITTIDGAIPSAPTYFSADEIAGSANVVAGNTNFAYPSTMPPPPTAMPYQQAPPVYPGVPPPPYGS